MLVLTWLWRLFLWSRCMRTLAHMNLRIIASHPDRAGGLAFVGQSLRGFPVLAIALGTAVAGTLANLVVYDNRTPHPLTPVVLVTALLILLLCAGPLLAFVIPLRQAKDDAELTYGALATALGTAASRPAGSLAAMTWNRLRSRYPISRPRPTCSAWWPACRTCGQCPSS